MTVWVLFMWMTATYPVGWVYESQAECEQE